MYQRVGQAAYRKDLHNIKLLANYLDHPEQHFKSIHVGGTNGKGSTSHMLASILQECGYKVGLYTSPHLKDFRERIRINGEMISEKQVVDFVQKHKAFFEEHQLSFFEMTVGLAFQTFAEQKVDIAIVEVGMGGRLDATNIIIPELSVITNIGFDHMKFLGDTLPKIATEKAGIIKPGIPVVIGEKQRGTIGVFKTKAKEQGSKIYFAEDYSGEVFESDLKGNYQQKNIKTVLQTIEVLNHSGWKISRENMKNGLNNVVKNTGLQGRWQTLSTNPLCITDTGHNAEGIAYVIKQLSTYNYNTLRLVMGFVNDKDVASIVNRFPKDAEFYFSAPDIPRAKTLEDLKTDLKALDINKYYFNNLASALAKAKADSEANDLIFIGGSIFTVAELLP
jgi:dihydrofolate synthase/folylpolyglutamate synthase